MRAPAAILMLSLLVTPAAARLWKPTPEQTAMDYATITHNKGAEGQVVIAWLASPVAALPTVKQLLDKYVVISIAHTRQTPGGITTWDDILGVQVNGGVSAALNYLTEATLQARDAHAIQAGA